MLSNTEIFVFLNSLIEKLEKDGEDQWVSNFRDAMAISFMPGELYREIRLVLKNFRKTWLPRKLKVMEELDNAIESLDKIIGGQ